MENPHTQSLRQLWYEVFVCKEQYNGCERYIRHQGENHGRWPCVENEPFIDVLNVKMFIRTSVISASVETPGSILVIKPSNVHLKHKIGLQCR